MALTSTPGSAQDFACTGKVQSFTAPARGIYKLEAVGAGASGYDSQANNATSHALGGAGGRSVGYVKLEAGQTVYVCVGGKGGPHHQGGYNGGGTGGGYSLTTGGGGGGGGATHFASALPSIGQGVLADYSGEQGLVLLVAGGGGGGSSGYDEEGTYKRTAGAAGGGESGADAGTYGGYGGTQNTGGAACADTGGAGTFGQGGTEDRHTIRMGSGGGGGGLYGGGSGHVSSSSGLCRGAGGGSGYTGGCPSFSFGGETYAPTTAAGGGSAQNTDGSARVTFVTRTTIPVVFNGTLLTRLIFNGTEAAGLIYDGVRLFARRLRPARA